MLREVLQGLHVLEVGRFISGPFCARLLADCGAQVIKVEPPACGDPARAMGPFLGDKPHPERSGLFLYVNTNKRGITLDLSRPQGAALFRRLARDADILVDNMPAGTLESWGLGYDGLRRLNPALIVVSITDFGLSGPHKGFKGSQLVHAAMGGWMSSNVMDTRAPVRPGGWVIHYVAGVAAALGAMTAVFHRDITGEGIVVELSQQEVMLEVGSAQFTAQMHTGVGVTRSPGSLGFPGLLPCRDGWVGLNAMSFRNWANLCKLVGHPELSEEPDLARMAGRQARAAELTAMVLPWSESRGKWEILMDGLKQGATVGFVATTEDIANFPIHEERGFFVEVAHPEMGKVKLPGPPFRLGAGAPHTSPTPAPTLGQHNNEVYQEAGLSQEEVEAMAQEGTI
ncbi:MAG: CoA transferase [Chloroflexi bacterium]|nr:CoA transferase [Chloroflexota bacterium]